MDEKISAFDQRIKSIEEKIKDLQEQKNNKSKTIDKLNSNIQKLEEEYKKYFSKLNIKPLLIPKYSSVFWWMLIAVTIGCIWFVFLKGTIDLTPFFTFKNIIFFIIGSFVFSLIAGLVVFLILKVCSLLLIYVLFKESNTQIKIFNEKKDEILNEISEVQKGIKDLENSIGGLAKEIEKEESNKEKYLKHTESVELYNKAINGVKFDDYGYIIGTPDYAMLKKAADLGNKKACFYYGIELFRKGTDSSSYTKAETSKFIDTAKKYLAIAADGNRAKLYYVSAVVMTEEISAEKGQKLLDQLRNAKKGLKMNEDEENIYKMVVEMLVQHINLMKKKDNSGEYRLDSGSTSSGSDNSWSGNDDLDVLSGVYGPLSPADEYTTKDNSEYSDFYIDVSDM